MCVYCIAYIYEASMYVSCQLIQLISSIVWINLSHYMCTFYYSQV